MSSEIKFRQQVRNRKRKQQIKMKMIMAFLAVLILAFAVFLIKNAISSFSNRQSEEPEFIFNGYVLPEPLPKNPDMLVDLKADGVKTAYLTFDDGPNTTVTVQVLDILRKYNIKATFFTVGTLLEKNPQVARRIYDEGHCLANHSYSHNYSELYADTSAFMSQINKTQELINKITGDETYPKVFRFPGGGYNAGSHGKVKQECKTALADAGYRYCDWNCLTGDAETKSPSASSIMKRIKSSSKDKEDLVVLMHDALAKTITPKTLPDVIDYLIAQGYTFDTLDNIS